MRGGARFGAWVVVAAVTAPLGGCALLADPSVYRDWPAERFIAFETFPNRPLCGVPGADADCVAPDPALDRPGEAPRAVASSRVLWAVDSACRDRFPAHADGRPPDRARVLSTCSASDDPAGPIADRNFVSVSTSGGGNRSAVFATEALFALDQWGLLRQADVLSGVSGGGFATALYAVSCDEDAEGAFCDEREPGATTRWRYETITERVNRNLGTAYVLRRFSPDEIYASLTSHRNTAHALSETIAGELLFHPGGHDPVRFADLNPRRPNLILNATNVSIDRQYLEREAGVPDDACRIRSTADCAHFAFTDYYFEKLLRSDLSRLPLAYATAASAAFPLIIDMPTLGRFSPRAIAPDAPAIDFIHLTDASMHDNFGLAEVAMILRDVFVGPPGAAAKDKPARVLVLVLDATLNDATGVSRADPDPRNIEALIWPLRLGNWVTALEAMLAAASDLRKERLETFLQDHVRRDCDARVGPRSPDATCARIVDIGVTHLDGHDSILVDGGFESCDSEEALARASSHKRRECAVMRALKSRETRGRLGLGDYHPQCYFEATRFAPTSFDHDPDAALCLRHAARWAVALAMAELCDDPEFGGRGFPADPDAPPTPIGIDCALRFPPLPPLPECPYARVVNARNWTDIPRQTSHCACLVPGDCRPETLP